MPYLIMFYDLFGKDQRVLRIKTTNSLDYHLDY
jgi:hypothetical protein